MTPADIEKAAADMRKAIPSVVALIAMIEQQERRATVQRIRERLRIPKDGFGQLLREVLDEESSR